MIHVVLPYFSVGRSHCVPEQKSTPVLIDLHLKFRREVKAFDSPSIAALQSFGGPEQLLALEQIIAFETIDLSEQGLTPWDEATLMTAKAGDAIRSEHGRKMGELRQARLAEDTARIDRLTKEVFELDRQFMKYWRIQAAESYWGALMRARDSLRSTAKDDG